MGGMMSTVRLFLSLNMARISLTMRALILFHMNTFLVEPLDNSAGS